MNLKKDFETVGYIAGGKLVPIIKIELKPSIQRPVPSVKPQATPAPVHA